MCARIFLFIRRITLNRTKVQLNSEAVEALHSFLFAEDHFIYFRMKLKNSKPAPIQVPISEPLKSLLRNIVGIRKKGPVFEQMPSDQAMNIHLKIVAKVCLPTL